MTNAIIIHGKPSKEGYFNPNNASASNALWIPWLQQQLQIHDIETQTPEMLHAWAPDYTIWKDIFERQKITSDTILIGHSCGAGFIVQWLSEHPKVTVKAVYLVAPAFGDAFNPETPYEVPLKNGFFDFDIDPELIHRTKKLHLLYSDNDSVRVDTAVRMLKKAIPAIPATLYPGYGHFRGARDMKNNEFPELLSLILNA